MSSGRHKLTAGGTPQRSDDLMQEAEAFFFFPLSASESDGWWDTPAGADRVWIWMCRGCTRPSDWPVCCRLTGEGAAHVSPVRGCIANTADGDGWKKEWTSGRERGRPCEREVGGGGGRGTEEKEKVEIWEDHDKRKQRQEVREVKDVGWAASVPLVAGVDVT